MSQNIPTPLTPANNLSDVASAAAARSNLGLGTAATHAQSDFDAAGAAATAQAAAVATAEAACCQRSANLSDVASAAAARTNLGLGTAATQEAGQAGGVATLDGSGHLATSQIPAALVGAVVYQGTWNAATNSPALTSGGGGSSAKGNYYVVSVAGTTALDGIGVWNSGDAVISDGSAWEKIDGVASEVLSFNGRTGAVTSQDGDYTAAQIGLGNVTNNLQLAAASNLSDLASAATARTNLGLGTAATQASSAFDAAGAAAAAQSAAQAACCQTANNLSDVASAATALANLLPGGVSIAENTNGGVAAGEISANHYLGSGATPTVVVGGAVPTGTGYVAPTVTGTDAKMQVTFTTGSPQTSNSSGVVFTVTFSKPFAAAPFPQFCCASIQAAAAPATTRFYVNATTTTLTISCQPNSAILVASATYTFNIWT